MDKYIKLDATVAEAILQYLAKRPYEEVYKYIQVLMSSERVDNTIQPEDTKDKK